MDKATVTLVPIGVIHSPYKTPDEAPCQGCGLETISEIEIFPEYADGLKDIDEFSHLIILYYFHKCKTRALFFEMPSEGIPHGIFTTRLPFRPNPIGFTVVSLLCRKGNSLHVKEMDAADGSIVLDIKPYIPAIDGRKNVKIGWLVKFWPHLASFVDFG